MHLRLHLQQSANGPQDFFTQGPSVLIGRAPHATVLLSDSSGTVSWQHARIDLAPTGAVIEDLGSTNGTYVNGQPLVRGRPVALRLQDVIQLGKAGPRLQVSELELTATAFPATTPLLAQAAPVLPVVAPAPVVARSPSRTTPLTEALPQPVETFGRQQRHGQETVPQRGAAPQRALPQATPAPVARLVPVASPAGTPSPTRYMLMQTQRQFRWFAVGVAAAGVGAALLIAVIALVLWNHESRIEHIEVDVAALNEKYSDCTTQIEDLREKTTEIDHNTKKMYEEIGQLDQRFAQLSAKQPAKPEDIYLRTAGSTVWLLQSHGSGSGVLIDRERGLVATAYHVVHGVNEVDVVFPKFYNGKILTGVQQYSTNGGAAGSREVLRGKIWASDPALDLAIVELPPGKVPPDILPLKLADASPNPGAAVHAVGGHPLGSAGMWVYSHGYVREVAEDHYTFATSQDIKAWVVATQNPINRGNSGGPLVNDRCEVVGITSASDPGANNVTKFIDVRHLREVLNGRPQKRLNRAPDVIATAPPPPDDKKPPAGTRHVHALLVILSNDKSIGASVAEDGRQMTQLLQGGLPSGRCTITRLDGNNVKEEEIARYYKNLKVAPTDTVLCYYSGHGCMVKENHFMVMSDGTGLPRYRLRQMVAQTHARLQVVISDSCASYPPASRDAEAVAAPPANVLTPLLLSGHGVVDWQAASPGQYAFNAIFTPSLNNAITLDRPRTWDVLFADTKNRTEKLYAGYHARATPGSAMAKQPSQTPYAFEALTAVRPD